MSLSIQDYETIDELGSGVYGIVYRAKHRQTGQIVAIKRVQRSRLSSDKLVANLRNEISIMQHIKHPNIVELYGIFETKNDICMVMELCEGGEIQTLMRRKKRFPEDLAQFYMYQLANALDFLAQNNLIHRDLKPSNILLATREERSILKLADFGYARVLDEADLASTSCGTPLYMAPEVFNNQPYDGKADLWSVGCILYEMVCGQVPYMAQNQVQLFQLIKSSPGVTFPPGIQLSNECRDLIERLLRKDPLHRMTFSQFYWNAFVRAGEAAFQQLIGSKGAASTAADQQTSPLRPRSTSTSASPPQRPRTSPFKQIPSASPSPSPSQPLPLPADAPVFPSPQQLPLQPQVPPPPPHPSSAASSTDEFVMIDKTQLQNFATADVITDARALGRLVPPSRPAPVAPTTTRAVAAAAAPSSTTAPAAVVSGSPPSTASASSSSSSSLSSSPPASTSARTVASPIPTTSTAVVSTSPPSVWSTSPTLLLKGAMTRASEKLGLTTPLADATARSVLVDLLPPVRHDVFSSRDERAQFEEIDQASRVAMVVCRLAEDTESTDQQDAYTLYCYALTLFTVAFRRARAFWEQHPQQTATLQGIVGFLETSYRTCLERAERLQVDLHRSYTSVGGPGRAKRIFELLLDRAKQLAYEGAIDEVVLGPPNYRTALQLLEALVITDELGLATEHRKLVQSYIERIKERLATLQKRHSISSEPFFKKISPPEAL